MKKVRRERLKSLILREISDIIRREVELPEGALITVYGVELSKDGSRATVYISSLKKEEALKAVEILNRAQGYIHHLLGKRLKLKVVPRPTFKVAPEVML